MKQVKAYELMTIEAALEGSYKKAVAALTIHPLVSDYGLSKKIVDGYMKKHGEYFPKLS
jgi:alpha-galactosidase/6-phospho-beta-glucosidase family protein